MKECSCNVCFAAVMSGRVSLSQIQWRIPRLPPNRDTRNSGEKRRLVLTSVKRHALRYGASSHHFALLFTGLRIIRQHFCSLVVGMLLSLDGGACRLASAAASEKCLITVWTNRLYCQSFFFSWSCSKQKITDIVNYCRTQFNFELPIAT